MRAAALLLWMLPLQQSEAADARSLVGAAKAAVQSGTVQPELHLQPILDALSRTRDDDEAGRLISGIEDLGAADGASPSAVKRYLLEQAPPVLLAAARSELSWSRRGSALMALRALDAPDAVLREAIEVANADQSPQRSYIVSRGELLQSWMDGRRGRPLRTDAIAEVEPAAEQKALDFLRSRRVGVSPDSLNRAAGNGETEVVAALLDAGVDVNSTGTASMTAVNSVLTLGCNGRAAVTDLIATLELLASRGADVTGTDARNNTYLMSAVQSCQLPLVEALLDLGVDVDPVNMQQFTPLAMAIVMGKIDVAELLVERGARLEGDAADRLFQEPPGDPRVQQLLKRARGG